jgi:hypothetical protein
MALILPSRMYSYMVALGTLNRSEASLTDNTKPLKTYQSYRFQYTINGTKFRSAAERG